MSIPYCIQCGRESTADRPLMVTVRYCSAECRAAAASGTTPARPR